jgi:hypothetical protein
MAQKNYVITAYASTINLTTTTLNPDAAPIATPRPGGFVIRNRWNCANLTTANKTTLQAITSAKASSDSLASFANLFRVVAVPKRTLVKSVNVFAVESTSIPQHAASGAATPASVDDIGGAWQLCFNAAPWKKSGQTSIDAVWASASEC